MNRIFNNHARRSLCRPATALGVALALASIFCHASEKAPNSNTTGIDASPVVAWRRDSETGALSVNALGPLIEIGADGEQNFRALPRPLFVHFSTLRTSGFDLAWPLVSGRCREDGYYVRFFNYLHTRKPQDDSVKRSRDWLLPILFTGTDNDGERYYGLFPVFGDIHNIIGFDKLSFVLFPIYLKADRGSTEGQSLVWPLFNRTKASEWHKWRVFPFYGLCESRDGNQRQQFLAWPLIHWSHWSNEDRSGNAWFVFPLLGRSREQKPGTEVDPEAQQTAQSTTVLWPFFLFATTPSTRTVHAPWPFVQFSHSELNGQEREKIYLWPFWGRAGKEEKWYRFLAWPLFHQWHDTNGSETVHRTWLVPLYRDQRHLVENDQTSRQLQVWPLFSIDARDETIDLKALDLWPMAPNPVIDRLFEPLYTLFHYKRDDKNDTLRWSLVWNTMSWESGKTGKKLEVPLLFKWKNSTEKTEFSLLKGFFSIRRGPKNSLKLFYFWEL
jgi:hypothetical protein